MPSREEEHLLLKMKDVEIISEVFTSSNDTACLLKEGIRQYLTEHASSNSQEADADRTVMVWTAMVVLEVCGHHFPVCSLLVKSVTPPVPAGMTMVAKIYSIEVIEEL